MAFGGIFECLLARVLHTFNFESEIKFWLNYHCIAIAYLIRLSPFTWFLHLLLLRNLFNYKPVQSYIVPNNKHTVILPTFGYNQTTSFVWGWRNSFHALTNVNGPACKNRPCECKLHWDIFLLISLFRMQHHISVTCRRKPIKFCSSDEDFPVVLSIVIQLW